MGSVKALSRGLRMVKVAIIGMGVQGSAIALTLMRVKEVVEVICADINLGRARRVVERLKDDRMSVQWVNADDVDSLSSVLRGVDVVINATLPTYNLKIMDAALKRGVHYVDLASDNPLEQLELNGKWEEAGLTAVITQGGPFIVNAAVKRAVEELDRVDEVRLRHGWRELKDDPVPVWRPSWCPEVALSEWEVNPTIYRDGRFIQLPPFSGVEEYYFPEPLGPVKVCLVDYEPVYTLPKFIGKGVRYVDCKIPLNLAIGTLISMGLTSRQPIEVKGVKVVPREVLMALVPHPADAVNNPVEQPNVLSCYLAEVKGEKAGEKLVHILYTFASTSEGLRSFGVREADVSVPTVVTALMLARGEVEAGVIPPEGLPTNVFLTRLSEWGINFQGKVVRLKE